MVVPGCAVVGGDAVLDHRLDLGQAGLDADRLGAGLAELDPVVAGRVVAGGDHRAGDAERPGGVVHHVGGAEPAPDDVRALGRRAAADRVGQRPAARAHVVQRDDRLRPGQPDKRRADGLGHALVKLVRDDTPDVISLEDLVKVAHVKSRLLTDPVVTDSSQDQTYRSRKVFTPRDDPRRPGSANGIELRLRRGRRGGAQHPQVTAAADLDALADGLGDGRARLRRRTCLAGRARLGGRPGTAPAPDATRPRARRSQAPRDRRPAPGPGRAAAGPRPSRAAPPVARRASRTGPRSAGRPRPQAARALRSSPYTRM